MRILNVTQSYAPFFEFGGPPVKVRALAEGLAARGQAITVLTADWGLDRRLQELPDEPPAEHNPFGRKRTAAGVTAIYLANWLHYRAASWNPALAPLSARAIAGISMSFIFSGCTICWARALPLRAAKRRSPTSSSPSVCLCRWCEACG